LFLLQLVESLAKDVPTHSHWQWKSLSCIAQ